MLIFETYHLIKVNKMKKEKSAITLTFFDKTKIIVKLFLILVKISFYLLYNVICAKTKFFVKYFVWC